MLKSLKQLQQILASHELIESEQINYLIKIASDAKYVLIKVKDEDGNYLLHHYLDAEKWDFPSGRVEENEALIEAAARELKERTGYQVSVDDLNEEEEIIKDDEPFAVFSTTIDKVEKVSNPQTEIKFSTIN